MSFSKEGGNNIHHKNSWIGIGCGLGTGALWGLAFLFPKILNSFQSLEIALGRYFFFGLFSILVFIFRYRKQFTIERKIVWKTFWYALSSNIGYYFLLVISIKKMGSSIPTLIIGTLPITVSLYGNWIKKEYPFRKMILPICFILVGLAFLHRFDSGLIKIKWFEDSNMVIGLFCCLTALGLWTWYGVSNDCFLKENPSISPALLSTLIGIQSFFIVICAILLDIWVFDQWVSHLLKQKELPMFVWISFLLGVLASWMGTWLWNQASTRLSVTLAGKLIVTETIFGLIYVYIWDQSIPTLNEWIGMIVILAGIFLGVQRLLSNKTMAHSSE
ncbi:DMT family transporter [Thermoflavimicrobium daqui]|uniref:EamA domain-containing protein n=1 Tax=Thermoflavimicrobium daqui TaxID=2137476 RepID=A0A364K269_9BACL|nr:DMT family transporter [Thermoflavimicrobium daqui]RAL22512.1 hypothetical protein DL897_13940 [Thermoflavimicrobium daqui]